MTQFDNILEGFEISRGIRGYLEHEKDERKKEKVAAIHKASYAAETAFTNAFNVALAARYRQLTDAAAGYRSPFEISLDWAILDAARVRATRQLEEIVFYCHSREEVERLGSISFTMEDIVECFAKHLDKYLEKRDALV